MSSMAVLGLLSFILGILPIKLASCLRWKMQVIDSHNGRHPLVISLLLCFGGGVLLNTTFMHLLPEVREAMDGIIKSGTLPTYITDSGIHLPELIFCVGFFFVYLIEETVHAMMHHNHGKDDLEVLHRSLSVRKCNMIPRITLSKPAQQSPPSTITASTQVLIRDIPYKGNSIDPIGQMTPPTAASSEHKTTVVKSFRGLLAVIALSFHAVFEGLAIGLELEPTSVWYLCAAVATHKLVIAFCIGIELVTSRTKTLLIFLYMATFAIVSPLGIGIGLAMSYDNTQNYASGLPLASVILQGMAAGTLLYVIFFEVLQREKSNARYGLVQLFSIIAGFLVLLALGLFSKLFSFILFLFT
ncbi:hypothetical protein O3M35_007425 [Rhynocoris fuscipes]|uniref:Zinc transporter ZIP1 n=1 Tax=Rhynocoris fuscipes TaxID=488301 RepID=A0AAW1DBX1_9HEMI